MTYQVIRSHRKTLAIQVHPDGRVIVRAPMRMKAAEIRQFVEENRDRIETHLQQCTAQPPAVPFTQAQLKQLAAAAKADLPPRVEHYASVLDVDYGRITIRAQHTRWASCSAAGNLNFNCVLMLCPEEIRDYIVVHELCHRLEMNHSPQFWAEVERILPDYRNRRKWLKEHGNALIARIP